MLISIIYASTAVKLMNNQELLDILHTSRRKNQEKNLTGMLLYKGGNFLQVLEGEEEQVLETFNIIQKDPRHTQIQIISQERITGRQFTDWQMAFVNLDDENIKLEPAYSMFLRDDFTADIYRSTPNLANIMLLAFKDSMR